MKVVVEISKATTTQLDWLVQSCLPNRGMSVTHYWTDTFDGEDYFLIPEYTTDWSQGGPIMEQEGIATYPMPGGVGGKWRAEKYGKFLAAGPTKLIAAMRCIVESRLGKKVEIPAEVK